MSGGLDVKAVQSGGGAKGIKLVWCTIIGEIDGMERTRSHTEL